MNTKPAPLGRGLSALFGDSDQAYQPRAAVAVGAVKEKVGAPRMIPIEWVQPGAYQPRRHFDEAAIKELAASIRERGVLSPLMVRPIEGAGEGYEIIAGERRWRAAQMAGMHEIPVLVRAMTDREAMEIGLIENVQRQDLSPLEEAEGYKRLLEEFQHTQDGLAKVVGKSRPHITNLLRLLTLPESVKKRIADGSLTMGHARTLVTAKHPEKLAAEIVKKGLSVRQAEALAKRELDGPAKKKSGKAHEPDADIVALEAEISREVGLSVKLVSQGGAGTLTFHFKDLDQLEGLLERLKK
jgi:ParB family chromosome partitioning protein